MRTYSASPAGAGQAALDKAAILTEALPWIEQFHGETIVVKYGGHAMIDEDLKQAFAQDIVFLRLCGVRVVVVHGGGPQISVMLDRLGIRSEFRGGLRVTTPEAMDVVRMARTRSGSPARTPGCSPPPGATPSSTGSRSTSGWWATSSRCARRRCST
jgi:hypothetical protein